MQAVSVFARPKSSFPGPHVFLLRYTAAITANQVISWRSGSRRAKVVTGRRWWSLVEREGRSGPSRCWPTADFPQGRVRWRCRSAASKCPAGPSARVEDRGTIAPNETDEDERSVSATRSEHCELCAGAPRTRKHKTMVEPVFVMLKQQRDMRQFERRGRAAVAVESETGFARSLVEPDLIRLGGFHTAPLFLPASPQTT